jgi:hypothetical protein
MSRRHLTAEKERELDEVFLSVKVFPIDAEKLIADLTPSLKEQLPHLKDVAFELAQQYGYIEAIGAILDEECVGSSQNTEEIPMEVRRKSEAKINENGETVNSFFPFAIWGFSTTPEEIKNYLKEPVDMKTFMGERYCYNSRVISNMYEFLPELKKCM